MNGRARHAVAVACSSSSWGGMEMQAVISAGELAGRGLPLLVLTGRGTRIAGEAAARGLEVHAVLSKSYIAPLAVARTAALFRKRKVRLVHAEYSKDLWTVVAAARLAGNVPVVLTKRLTSSVNKTDPLHRHLYGRTARIVAISRTVAENLARRTPVPPAKIVTIPDGVDLSLFPPWGARREETRRDLSLPPGGPAIGIVGRISQGKGHLDFLRAARLVAGEFPEAHFLVIGSVTRGEEAYGRKVEELAAETGLGPRLRFTGFRTDVPRLLGALDVLVVPSRSESLGDVVLEGMAASLPVAGTGRAGIGEIVLDGVTGLLFPPDDPAAIARAVLRLLADPSLRRSMGEAGRRRVEEEYDQKRRTDRILDLYAGIWSEERERVRRLAGGRGPKGDSHGE